MFSDRTLLLFEQFLYTSKGPSSEENTCYKLWKSITQFQKTPTRKHDSLSIHIHRTFISVNSKFHLPEELCDFLDQGPENFSDADKLRPKSTTFMKLKKLTEEFLDPAIKEFLHEVGEFPDDSEQQQVNRKVFPVHNGQCWNYGYEACLDRVDWTRTSLIIVVANYVLV